MLLSCNCIKNLPTALGKVFVLCFVLSKTSLFPLQELEKLGSRKLRMNVKEVMKVAEKLYANGFISYPRTETNIFPPELPLAPLVEMQTADPNWGGLFISS